MINLLGGDMVFADPGGAIALVGEHSRHRQRDDVVPRGKLVIAVLVAIHAVAVIVQAGHDDRATGGAAGGRSEGILENRAVGSDGIDGGSDRSRIAVTSERWRLVIGDDEDDIALRSIGVSEQSAAGKDKGEKSGRK